MNQIRSEEPDSLSGTRRIWLLLLLLVLIVVLVTYDQGSVRVYGEKAYTSATTLTEKVTRWAKKIYECGLPGCKSDQATTPVTNARVKPNAPATTGQENLTAATTTAQPAPGREPKSEWAAVTTPHPAQEAPATAAQAESASPSYPPSPTYPAYPPASTFGSGGSAAGVASTPAADSPAPVAPAQLSAAPASAPPPVPATSTPPAAEPTALPYLKPASPPPAPPSNVNPLASPAQSPQVLLPAPRAVRPDLQQNQPQKSAAPSWGREWSGGLALARKSAQAGRLDESVHIYLHYLTTNPHDVNAYGELGNVYLEMGRYPEAAQNYYEAATRLIDAGQMNAVSSLMPVIQMHEPMLANLLNQKIARATEGNRGQPR